jgi:putative N6-adenine-specific DNA methylase
MESYEMVATTFMGLEKILAKEIQDLGGTEIEIMKRAVKFAGDDAMLYRSNMALRTGLRILVPICTFSAYNEHDLYNETKSFSWENLINIDQTFAIDATISGALFTHSKYVALKVKDAIVDRYRDKSGERPNIDTENPDVLLNVHINYDSVTISLDSSGTSLDKRGYRKNANEAPINEALAAGILLTTAWTPDVPFYDPMAGSGTFSIEAAMIGTNTPPGLNRKFNFENWIDFDKETFKKVKEELIAKISKKKPQIFTRDIDESNIEIIKLNAKNAGVLEYLDLKTEDFFLSQAQSFNGVLVLNPPYNERIKIENPEEFYALLGDTFKKNYQGFDAWIISSEKEALKRVGLRAEQKTDLMNGGLEARLQKYVLFAGKRF